MNKIISTIVLFTLLNGCGEDSGYYPPGSRFYFEGLTITDPGGFVIYRDTTDWRTDDKWLKRESNLFSSIYQTNCIPNYNYRVGAEPNPCGRFFEVGFDVGPSARVELRMVNSYFNTIISLDSIFGPIAFDSDYFKIKDTVRLYYRFIEGKCEFRGHGDILIQ